MQVCLRCRTGPEGSCALPPAREATPFPDRNSGMAVPRSERFDPAGFRSPVLGRSAIDLFGVRVWVRKGVGFSVPVVCRIRGSLVIEAWWARWHILMVGMGARAGR